MTTWADEYLTMLDDCEKREERLTDWERGFVDSLRRQIEQGRRPLFSAGSVRQLFRHDPRRQGRVSRPRGQRALSVGRQLRP